MGEQPLLSIADTLKLLQDNIQAEDKLIATRVTWYVTSQAFLLTAYAASWSANFAWPYFFHELVPWAAIGLSLLTLASVYAATWAQETCLREQTALVSAIKSRLTLSAADALALGAYENTMVGNRKSKTGRALGNRIHEHVRIPPLVVPVGFSLLWLFAYLCAPEVLG